MAVQIDRNIGVTTTAGEDILLLRSMTATERLSGLFEITLDLVSEVEDAAGISPKDLLGKPMTVWVNLSDGTKRYFNGYTTRFTQVGGTVNETSYRAMLRPWLWYFTKMADCRIFQEKTTPDIVMQVFREHGFTDFKPRLDGDYTPREYCVQYRETAFNFVSRLMEEEGIYYYFEHQDGKHTLVLADGYGSHATIKGYSEIPYFPPDEHARRKRDHLSEWEVSREIQVGKYVHTDFDFENPSTPLLATRDRPMPISEPMLEVFDFPGGYKMPQGSKATWQELDEQLVRIRLEEQQALHEAVIGRGDVRGLASGALFTLSGHPVETQNREYMIVGANYHATATPFASSAADEPETFHCAISAIEAKVQYRPPRIAPKPLVQGPQTAFIVGKAGEEIWTDAHGRVKVQFHWDRLGKKDEHSSCWIRVAQLWAGKGWGAMFMPRIGQEVIVDFLEGDPERPIVVGRVYNGESKVPHPLPANQTYSTIKSESSKGGGGFNELRMEDKKGSEDFYIHAQKDMHRIVKNNDDLSVGNSQTIKIQNSLTETVVKGSRTTKVDTGDDTHAIGKGNRAVTIGMGNDTLEIKMGNQTTKLGLGKSETEALQSIELKVGQSSVKVDQTGVTIKGLMINIEGTVMTDVKGAMTQVNGTAMTTIKGGITMIG